MSDTAFIQETGRPNLGPRVELRMDYDEVEVLGLVAGAAVDASVVAPDLVDESTTANALEILRWATAATKALKVLTPGDQE